MLVFLSLPLMALFLRIAPARLIANFGDPYVLQAIGLSLATTVVTTLIIILGGTPVAYSLARRQYRFRRAIDTLIDLPTVLPPAVAGVALLMAFGRRGILGGLLDDLGIHIAFTPIAVSWLRSLSLLPFT